MDNVKFPNIKEYKKIKIYNSLIRREIYLKVALLNLEKMLKRNLQNKTINF